ncbi:GNAT family N-acetyltransferase [Stigmatella aurantiaca]|uniref:acetyltransferase, GNAT family n=1 Tax=Stigmatella aurantiaca (strain DW4/3-1) TaxID=378806 RepID=Q09CU2_STIAD|nr:GNAT family N-acetyltransferase [Stigmatella aurantiaca]ADO70101.1 Acetyltransferase, GNAT family [Stigmatella aurantiaca DW4/3-1]EAU69541.1 acetyltransferase, gnat family [Stigmatella aurantiaca DW4/3-1]
MAPRLSLRTASAGDRLALWRLHTRSISSLCRDVYSDHEVKTWVGLLRPEAYLPPDPPRTVLVAEQDDQLVGFGQLDLVRGELEALYVSPEAVGLGVGSALLSALEALAWHANVRAMSLDASLNAEPFYRARGYMSLHAARRILTSEVYLPCTRMQKRRPSALRPATGDGPGQGLTPLPEP